MFKRLANQDSWFFRYGTMFFDMLIVSALFAFTSLPIITLGPSFVALYGVTSRNILKNRGNILRDYFRLFKENFLNAMIYMLFFMIFLAGGLLLAHAAELAGAGGSLFTTVLRVLFIPIGLAFPYGLSQMIHFENTLGQTLRNAYIFAYTPPLHFFISLALLALLVLGFLLCMVAPGLLFIFPAGWCAIASLPIEKMMKPYLPEERDD